MNFATSSTPIAQALKRLRDRITLDEMAERIGVSRTTIVNYESGKRDPDQNYLAAFAEATGADFLELLRLRLASSPDEPAQRMAERLKGATAPTGALDLARFRLAIETAEEGLAAAGRVMAADNKAELILAVYDLLGEPAITRERVLKLVKLAA